MSTTVTYKGDTLTTVDNNTKTLKTAGKYMEDDIVLVDTAAEGSQENNPIRFFDYDGTIVASYTEVPESLPPNPTHEGLTAQGWNWTLEDIATQFESTGACDIGQMYITDDGKTRIYITVSDQTKSFWLGLAPNGTLSINWGDGSEVSNMTGTSLTTLTTVYHSYTIAGSYVISITVESGEFAFYGTTSSYTRLLNKFESNVGEYNQAYCGCVTAIELGDSAKINNYAFTCLFNMTYITIPDSVINIGATAFRKCSALKSITIPSNVTIIGSTVFSYCYTLKFVTIPSNVTVIGGSAFSYCYALRSIIIPSNVTTIGSGVFDSCYALKSITIPSSITTINGTVFQNCYALKSITIPSNVTTIGKSAFSNCTALQSITIPSSVTSIGSFAFSECHVLESITIPDSVTSIDRATFSQCHALKSITIPNTVTSIGNSAFTQCYNMDEYHFLSTTPPTLVDKSAFDYIQPACKMYVPYSADHSILEAYKTATNWSTYADHMVEEGE